MHIDKWAVSCVCVRATKPTTTAMREQRDAELPMCMCVRGVVCVSRCYARMYLHLNRFAFVMNSNNGYDRRREYVRARAHTIVTPSFVTLEICIVQCSLVITSYRSYGSCIHTLMIVFRARCICWIHGITNERAKVNDNKCLCQLIMQDFECRAREYIENWILRIRERN